MAKPQTRRPIDNLDDAQRIIDNLRKENKNLRQQKTSLQALIEDLKRRITAIQQ